MVVRELDRAAPALSGKLTLYAVLCLLAIATIVTRVHGLDLPLWLDESWVANSVLEPTVREMMYYRTRLQTVPPLFLLSARSVVRVLGISNESFRLLPVVFGLLSFPLMILAARRLLRSFFAFVAIGLFVFSPAIVHYTHEFKQFSGDVFVSLTLLNMGLLYLSRPSRRLLVLWTALYVVLLFLSYQAVLFLPGFCLVVLLGGPDVGGRVKPWRERWLEAGTAAFCGSAATLVAYVVFILPNTLPRLYTSFSNAFEGDGARQFLAFYFRKVLFLGSMLLPEEGAGRLDLAARIVILGGILLAAGSLRRRGRGNVLIFLGLPILCAYVLDALGRYPGVGIPRLMLFSVPIVILLFVYGAETIAHRLGALRAREGETSPVAVVDSLGAVCFALMLGLIGTYVAKRPVPLLREELVQDTQGSVRYVSERGRPDDVVYVHAGMVEQFRLYSRLTPMRSGRVIYGRVGWGCCPRVPWLKGTQDEITLPEEVARLEVPRITKSIWLLYEDGPGQWDWFDRQFGRRDPEVFAVALSSAGCRAGGTKAFHWIRVDRFDCDRPGGRPR
ncbi:MAG TPA: hypothetical protein VGQ24_10730 [Gemmatimonadales bacterium]|jgi:hypothetical protein|nr:hypothetical protein [Gemmatimonadales bacterium]